MPSLSDKVWKIITANEVAKETGIPQNYVLAQELGDSVGPQQSGLSQISRFDLG